MIVCSCNVIRRNAIERATRRLAGDKSRRRLVTPGAVFNHRAAQAIATHEDAGPARDLAAWMREHPEAKVLALPSVADALRLQEDAPPHLDDPADPAVELVAFTLLDHPAPGRLPSNVPDRTVAWFGPRDVDLEYYTAWLEPWIFLVPRETAVEWNVFDASRGD